MTERETFLDLLHGLLMQSSIFYLLVHFFSRSFYAKKLSIKVHVVFKVHTFDQYACSVGINHMTLPLLKPCSPIELQEQ